MTETCPRLVYRTPHKEGEPVERSTHLAICGRPVERDGLCKTHLRKDAANQRVRVRVRA